ncbi:FAD-dependent oxidoreductase [Brevibacterium metallidurans]|uniref:FAD-dependent oxidoreductase n=1 Tax=Brevibacterium metallidurans TaxID=1482676 RepID=UPI0030D71E9C
MSISRVAVVGAGIIGVALAREITRQLPDAEVTVFERGRTVGGAQTGHTAGIVHAGFDEEPGSLEATLARRGVELLIPYLAEAGLPYRECGQLVVAQDTDEVDRLEELASRAEKNGVPGIRLVDRARMEEIEPGVRGVQALYSPHTAITDYPALAEALAAEIRDAGGRFRFSTEVTGIDTLSSEVRLRTRPVIAKDDGVEKGGESGYSTEIVVGPDGEAHDRPRTYRGEDSEPAADPAEKSGLGGRLGDELRTRFGDKDWFKQAEERIDGWNSERKSTSAEVDAGTFDVVLVAAGLQSDRLATATGLSAEPRIVPLTSTYSQLSAPAAEAVHGIISSVPDPGEPFEETVLARTVSGALLLGPTTHLALGRGEGSVGDIDFGDLGASFGFSGFWKFAKRNARAAAEGVRSATSTSAFVERIKRYAPDLDTAGMTTGPRGVGGLVIDDKGELVTSLVVSTRGRLTQVRSVPKAGATSALAIAEHVVASALKSAGRR